MIRKDIVRLCLLDAAHGELHSLMGMLDYLLKDCHIQPDRLVKIGEREFGIPQAAGWDIIWNLAEPVIH